LIYLIKQAKKQFPNAIVQGHRDFGANKACPSFDAKNEYKTI
jgi:N-acetylmuramoyl-L-alanine amidase